MEMELYPLLSTIILVTTIATIVFAFFSYLAYRARAQKAVTEPPLPELVSRPRPQLFRRYEPNV